MLRLLGRGIKRVFTKGPWDTARWVRYHLYEGYRERRLGIDTADCDEWADSQDDPSLSVYEPLSYECIDRAMAAVDVRPGRDVLLDYGSGKGRIVTVAATHPFKRVIGIELLPELNAIAKENLRKAEKRLRCREVELLTVDATQWEVPEDVSVVFFFNPFRGSVLAAVLDQIRASLQRNPRRLSIIYVQPKEDDNLFEACDWLTEKRRLSPGRWEAMRFVIYESSTAEPGR